MKRFLILILGLFTVVSGYAQQVRSSSYNTVVILTSANASPWTIPTNFNNVSNLIECVGRGGAGSARFSSSIGGLGGGGGSYCSIGGGYHFLGGINLGTPGLTVDFQIGTGASNVTTWIKTTAGSKVIEATGGSDATTVVPGAGGVSTIFSTNIITYPGGNGGSASNVTGGTGGAGAAGPNGEGTSGGGLITGGAADNMTLMGQVLEGQPGYNGSEWVTAGSGSGGAGGGLSAQNGGAGGRYGGGGGGAHAGSAANIGGAGSDGVIVISYNATDRASPTPTPTSTPAIGHKDKMLFRKSQP